MPIYEYECGDRHRVERFFRRHTDALYSLTCPDCGKPARRVVSQLARVDIKRDWNEKANDWQGHGAYHQAKAQLNNMDRENQERQGAKPMKITEEAIQAAAKQIDDQKRNPKAPPEVRAAKAQRARAAKAKKNAIQ